VRVVEKSADDILYVVFACFVEERRCINVFHVLSFDTVCWFDMGVMLVLRTPWWLVLEACEGFGDILEHGYVDGLSHVVPVDVHAEVPLHVIIVGALIVLAENEEGEVFGMLTANILDAKIIRTQ
jgi:hypothetical protein